MNVVCERYASSALIREVAEWLVDNNVETLWWPNYQTIWYTKEIVAWRDAMRNDPLPNDPLPNVYWLCFKIFIPNEEDAVFFKMKYT